MIFAQITSLLCWHQLLLWAITVGCDLLLVHLKQSIVALLASQDLSLLSAWHTPHEVGEPREEEGIYFTGLRKLPWFEAFITLSL